ncbi:AfsR/SARP family transcriptional regulator [Kineococcus indalonis]|uniref:AfsR/SARP family transcriptional regulator n=1 Tax=Kineococcus indalonis TaxID=2696566 RepID=UPI001412EFF9|nr:BTAD domain-containing putative transcriptional regulator [Kineococcus indalonis]NAZ84788.1 SARP family transcriptional regulator [Kineococcus indalonis]
MSVVLPHTLIPRSVHGVVVHLFAGPYVTVDGRRVEIPEGGKRLLVFVILNGTRVERRLAASTLWPDGDDVRAAGNLRSALWRLRGAGLDLLECDKGSLRLRGGTVVDVVVACEWAGRLIDGTAGARDLDATDVLADMVDLMPGWYDDWVIFERERVRQRLLHALEEVSRRLVREGRHAAAIDAAMCVIAADPLRESAVRALLEAHLAEGNINEARRAYRNFAHALSAELGVMPIRRLRALVASTAPRTG